MDKKQKFKNELKEKHRTTLRKLKTNRITKYDFIGFDVETHSENNDFLMGGFFYYKGKTERKPIYKSFWNKESMIKYIMNNKDFFRKRKIIATNLEFDYTVLFKDSKYWNCFELLYRGGSLVYIKEKNNEEDKKGLIEFLDTMNYIKIGVADWGDILGEHKLSMPSSWEKTTFKDLDVIIPRKPKNQREKKELEQYNKMDCKISCDAMYLLQKGFNELGCNLKITSSSTAMELYRRKYLPYNLTKEEKILGDQSVTSFLFQAYYGGRTEVFKKGGYKNIYYYDVNSLYPSVMIYQYPVPDSAIQYHNGTNYNIFHYEGVSRVRVTVPSQLNKPFLPLRRNGKLLFPAGEFEGTYTHVELRKAVNLGYKIKSIGRQVIYTQTNYLFKNYVNDLYKKRLEQKKNNDPLQTVTKLLLNSLYGKFGMKKLTKTTILKIRDLTNEEFDEALKGISDEDWTDKNGYINIRIEEEYKGNNQFPILASYISANARILMYDYVKREDCLYTDTDSVFLTKPLEDEHIGKELGKMKLEDVYDTAFFVKPKFYHIKNKDENIVKIKGLNRASEEDFYNILKGEEVKKWKFTRLKESLVSNDKSVNQLNVIKKTLTLLDEKRVWDGNNSFPIVITE